MYEMRKLGVTINAKAIAQGVLEMMREQDENNEALIRFGLLPAKWMEMIEKQFDSNFRERWHLLPEQDQFTTIVNPESETECRVVDFSMKKLVQECMREVTLALYDSVDMVV